DRNACVSGRRKRSRPTGVFSPPQAIWFFKVRARASLRPMLPIAARRFGPSIPVTYAVKGEQYVLTPVGWGSGSRLFAPAWTMATPQSKRGPTRLLAFKLGATTSFPVPPDIVPPVPKPPQQTASQEVIRRGEKLYVTWVCDGCHSPGTDGSGAWVLDGAVPDLRYAPPEVHSQWQA